MSKHTPSLHGLNYRIVLSKDERVALKIDPTFADVAVKDYCSERLIAKKFVATHGVKFSYQEALMEIKSSLNILLMKNKLPDRYCQDAINEIKIQELEAMSSRKGLRNALVVTLKEHDRYYKQVSGNGDKHVSPLADGSDFPPAGGFSFKKGQGSKVAEKLLVSDVFRLDADLQVLGVRSSFQFARHPIVSQRVANFITSGQLLLQPFFAQRCFIAPRPSLDPHQPPSLRAFWCNTLFLPSSSPSRGWLPLNSIRFFKKLRNTSSSSSSSLSPLQPSQWRSFWSLAIPLTTRTVWYRAISEKIPTRALLHLRIPDKHPPPLCTICSTSTTEDITHALFSCPPKLLVWRHIYHIYLSVSTSISDVDLIHFLQQVLFCSSPPLDRDNSFPFNELSIPQLFAITLLTIWQAHWRWIFD